MQQVPKVVLLPMEQVARDVQPQPLVEAEVLRQGPLLLVDDVAVQAPGLGGRVLCLQVAQDFLAKGVEGGDALEKRRGVSERCEGGGEGGRTGKGA